MPSYKRPGVFIEENLTPSFALSGPSTSTAGFLAPNARGPVEPTLVESWNQYLALYGGFAKPGDLLPHAVHQYFSNSGQRVYVNRVVGAGAVRATRDLLDRSTPVAPATPPPTLRVDAHNAGGWGNSIFLDISDSGTERFNLVVKLGGPGDAFTVERWLDLSMNDGDSRYAPSIINSLSNGSTHIRVTDLNSPTAPPADRPAVQSGTVLAGGADGAAPTAAERQAAINLFDQVTVPLNLNLPGEFDVTTVNAALAYAAARGDVFVIIDTQEGRTAAQAVAYAETLTQTSYGAVYYPWILVSDPSSSVAGALKKVPPGPAAAGQYAATDTLRGVFKTPAGVGTRLGGALALETKLTNADLELLNQAQVNAIRHMPGVGIAIMGGRTLRNTSADRYISIRRSLIYVRRAISDATQFAVFEVNDTTLWSALQTNIEQFLLEFWQAGGLRGAEAGAAFYVKCDDETNPPSAIASGEVRVEIGVALQAPAEFVIIRIAQFNGGTRVSETTAE